MRRSLTFGITQKTCIENKHNWYIIVIDKNGKWKYNVLQEYYKA